AARIGLPGSSSEMSSAPETESFEFVPAVTAIAREAGALLMEYFRRRVKIEYKGEDDVVTEADRSSEALIIRRVREQFPPHAVIGEESGSVAATSASSAGYRWYVY